MAAIKAIDVGHTGDGFAAFVAAFFIASASNTVPTTTPVPALTANEFDVGGSGPSAGPASYPL